MQLRDWLASIDHEIPDEWESTRPVEAVVIVKALAEREDGGTDVHMFSMVTNGIPIWEEIGMLDVRRHNRLEDQVVS